MDGDKIARFQKRKTNCICCFNIIIFSKFFVCRYFFSTSFVTLFPQYTFFTGHRLRILKPCYWFSFSFNGIHDDHMMMMNPCWVNVDLMLSTISFHIFLYLFSLRFECSDDILVFQHHLQPNDSITYKTHTHT